MNKFVAAGLSGRDTSHPGRSRKQRIWGWKQGQAIPLVVCPRVTHFFQLRVPKLPKYNQKLQTPSIQHMILLGSYLNHKDHEQHGTSRGKLGIA